MRKSFFRKVSLIGNTIRMGLAMVVPAVHRQYDSSLKRSSRAGVSGFSGFISGRSASEYSSDPSGGNCGYHLPPT
jgi:hypothetical protein